jgi:hypothetical protein
MAVYTVQLIPSCPDFLQVLRPTLNAVYTKQWDSAVEYFAKNEGRIKQIRNDIGGHFGTKAVEYSLGRLDSSVIGSMEFYYKSPGIGGVRFRFAPYLANLALLRHATSCTIEEQVEEMIDLANEAMS